MAFSTNRRDTRQIQIGNVKIGGFAPISVQSMTNTPTHDIAATVAQIKRLESAGCEIIRVAVPYEADAEAIASIKKQISIPLIADIHFDHRLAIAAARAGADALRINPGNIGSHAKVKEVVDCAKDHGIAIRVGVNAGSLEKDILNKYKAVTAEAMVESALRNIDLLKSLDFHDLKISLKASDVQRTVESYRLLAEQSDLPLHVGVTEAGSVLADLRKFPLIAGLSRPISEKNSPLCRIEITWLNIPSLSYCNGGSGPQGTRSPYVKRILAAGRPIHGKNTMIRSAKPPLA